MTDHSLWSEVSETWTRDVHRMLSGWPHRVWVASPEPGRTLVGLGAVLESPPLSSAVNSVSPMRVRTKEALHLMMEGAPEVICGLTVPPDRGHPLLDPLLCLSAASFRQRWAQRQHNFQARALAHEIRNPLTLVSGYAELLGHRGEQDLSRLLLEEVARVNQSLEEFLNAGRPMNIEPVDLIEVVREAWQHYESAAYRQQVRATVKGEPAMVRADRRHLSTVVTNLIRNALEAMPHGGHLIIQAGPAPGGGEIMVQDTGPGVAQESAAHIFRPYFSTKPSGHGLGLALAWELVARHGGSLELLPSDKGARFRAWIPWGQG